MALFGDATIKRLRKGPALLLPGSPHPGRLLEMVRLFDPEARAVEGGIALGGGVRLTGPIVVDASLSAKADLPNGTGAAIMASDSGPFQTWLLRGLARRLNGMVHPATAPMNEDVSEIIVVHTPRQISPAELAARLGRYLPGLTVDGREADGSFFLATPAQPIHIRCDGPEVASLRWLLPPALGPLRNEPDLHGYRFSVSGPARPDLVRLAAAAALELSHGVGGVPTDLDRFVVHSLNDPGLHR